MAYLTIAVAWAGSIAGSVYLVTHGHPWFGLLVFVVGMSARTTSKRDEVND